MINGAVEKICLEEFVPHSGSESNEDEDDEMRRTTTTTSERMSRETNLNKFDHWNELMLFSI